MRVRYLNTVNMGDCFVGIWAPPNSLSKAMALKLLFPNISNQFKMPDLQEVPLHVAVAYDAYKGRLMPKSRYSLPVPRHSASEGAVVCIHP